MPRAEPGSPFRFLDPYEEGDTRLFFGRDREVRTLLADVLVSRLVVLFARTGTGKTSLIRAGVRPALERRGYRTFVVRVNKDPIGSAREELRRMDGVPRLARTRFAKQLARLARDLEKPIVVFFDQFEEFFVYLMTESPGRFQKFIRAVAEVREHPDVHLVFSMREEFFVEMEAFRDEIPSIFHAESNLRLRGFDAEATAAAITGPVGVVGGSVEDGLSELIFHDLAENGRVEPARLQIVCDTLWHDAPAQRLSLSGYERSGRARGILRERLREDVRRLDEPHLRLFERLVPELRTTYGTKYLRGVTELAERLAVDTAELDGLLGELDARHLVRESLINAERYVEWASDYLAARSDDLQATARATLYRGILRAARPALPQGSDVALAEAAWKAAQGGEPPLPADEFGPLSDELTSAGQLPSGDAAYGFGASLALRKKMDSWFHAATRAGVDVWRILDFALDPGNVEAPVINAIDLLADLGDAMAMSRLERALEEPDTRDPALAALARVGDERAIRVLQDAARKSQLAGPAIDALRRMRSPRALRSLAGLAMRGGPTGFRAAVALRTLAASQPGGEPPAPGGTAAHAADALSRALDRSAQDIFAAALEYGIDNRFWFEEAERRGFDVWETLESALAQPERRHGATELLRELGGDSRARDLLEHAERPQPADRPHTRRRRGMDAATWARLVDRVRDGRCVPVIGAGAANSAELAEELAANYEYPFADTDDLARVAGYVAINYDAMLPKEVIAERVRGAAASAAHAALASLPLPLYVTTAYDDAMAQALMEQGRDPDVAICRWNDSPALTDSRDVSHTPTASRPLVFHLFGHVSIPESIVLSEDDHLDFLVRVASNGEALPYEVRRALATSTLLLLGYAVSDWPTRVLRRTLRVAGDSSLRRLSIAVQPSVPEVNDYVEDLFRAMSTSVYFGTDEEFAHELTERVRR